jgi:hypothetical protein
MQFIMNQSTFHAPHQPIAQRDAMLPFEFDRRLDALVSKSE